jgi:hypothetical protein
MRVLISMALSSCIPFVASDSEFANQHSRLHRKPVWFLLNRKKNGWPKRKFRNIFSTITARSVAFIGDENADRAPAPFEQGSSAMQIRRRFKQDTPLQSRLAAWARDVREEASQLKPGPERDVLMAKLLAKARQAETAANLDDWINAKGSQLPN